MNKRVLHKNTYFADNNSIYIVDFTTQKRNTCMRPNTVQFTSHWTERDHRNKPEKINKQKIPIKSATVRRQ